MTQRATGARIVRYDPMLPTAGLFGSVTSADRPKLDVQCEFGGVTWHLRGPDMLGVAEQTLLLVLMELAHEQYSSEFALDADWQPLVQAMATPSMLEVAPRTSDGAPVTLAALAVSYAELVRRCGRRNEGGSAARQLRVQLKRLCEVSVWFEQPKGVERRTQLLHWRVGDGHGVQVVLNWRLTEILLGKQYSPVLLSERLRLESDIARALHCALSVHIRPGATRAYAVDDLARFVWPGHAVAESTTRRRRQQLRKALIEIGQLARWRLKVHDDLPLGQAVAVTFHRKELMHVRRAGSSLMLKVEPADVPQGSSVTENYDPARGHVDISSWFVTPQA